MPPSGVWLRAPVSVRTESPAQICVGGMGEVYRATDTQLNRGLMVVQLEGS